MKAVFLCLVLMMVVGLAVCDIQQEVDEELGVQLRKSYSCNKKGERCTKNTNCCKLGPNNNDACTWGFRCQY